MSGILSLARELLAIYAPDRVAAASLFWRCVWIAFILSAAIAWYEERTEVVKLKRAIDDSQPRLSGEIHYVYAADGKDQSGSECTGVFMAASIHNSGAKSVARGWRLRYRGAVEFDELPYCRLRDVNLQDLRGKPFAIRRDESLAENAITKPIERGEVLSGWLLFHVPGIRKEEILSGKAELIVTFSDYLAVEKKYKMRFTLAQSLSDMAYVPGIRDPFA